MNKDLLRVILPTLSVDDLVQVILDTEEPYIQTLPIIMENNRQSLRDIKEDQDEDFLLDAFGNGDWRETDTYFFYHEDACEIYSFSTTEQAIDYLGLSNICDAISEALADDEECEDYEIARDILRRYATELLDELKAQLYPENE